MRTCWWKISWLPVPALHFHRAARILAEEGPDLLQQILVKLAGITFDHNEDGELEYGQEGAHSRRRILHVGDGTGERHHDRADRRFAKTIPMWNY